MLTNSHTPGFKLGLCMRLQVCAEALCGLLHNNLVHAVESNAHQATQPCGAYSTAQQAGSIRIGAKLAAAVVHSCLAPTERKSFTHTFLEIILIFRIDCLLCLVT